MGLNMVKCLTECIFTGIRSLSVAELNELLEEVETAIRHYSEELVRQLALRDELDFAKEVMNGFISVLIDIENLQKEHKELLKKKRKVRSGVREQNGRLQRLSASVSNSSVTAIGVWIYNIFKVSVQCHEHNNVRCGSVSLKQDLGAEVQKQQA